MEWGEQVPGAVIRDLGDGLVMRWSRTSDAEALVEFNGNIFRREGQPPDGWLMGFTRSVIGGPHPTAREGDATIVEDTSKGAIVSSMCFIPQTWACDGVVFGVGRPESVATHPDYRRRGLIRAQFEVFHEWSACKGHLMTAVGGIPWYYRQFGYDMALDMGGSRTSYVQNVPELKDGECEPYRIRPAALDDVGFLGECYDTACRESLYSCVRDAAIWRYEMQRGSEEFRDRLCIIETLQGARVGCFAHTRLLMARVSTWFFHLLPGISYAQVAPTVMRHLSSFGQSQASRIPDARFDSIEWTLGPSHILYDVFSDRMPKTNPPYAWYVRVPDWFAFLNHLKPVLERRLEQSPLSGYTGHFKVNGYTWGLELVIEQGRIVAVAPWRYAHEDQGDVRLPDRTFLHVLFGRRTLEEIAHMYPDCGGTDEGKALLGILFPKRPSNVLSVA